MRELTQRRAHVEHVVLTPSLALLAAGDLYESSWHALEWLLRNGLVVEGTLVGYDDW
jgi:hypothetical protein